MLVGPWVDEAGNFGPGVCSWLDQPVDTGILFLETPGTPGYIFVGVI